MMKVAAPANLKLAGKKSACNWRSRQNVATCRNLEKKNNFHHQQRKLNVGKNIKLKHVYIYYAKNKICLGNERIIPQSYVILFLSKTPFFVYPFICI